MNASLQFYRTLKRKYFEHDVSVKTLRIKEMKLSTKCFKWYFFRCWAKVTADILEVPLPEDIPDTDPFFLQYGPDYTFKFTPGMRKNTNTPEYVKNIVNHVCENLHKLGT